MNLESLVRPTVLAQPVYEPGKPIEDVARELGLDPAGIIKLASNENPFGPSPKALDAARRALEHGELYPDGGCFALRQKLAGCYGLGADQFIVGNGSNEILELLGHALPRARRRGRDGGARLRRLQAGDPAVWRHAGRGAARRLPA